MTKNLKYKIILVLLMLNFVGCSVVPANSSGSAELPIQQTPGEIVTTDPTAIQLRSPKTVLLFSDPDCSDCQRFISDAQQHRDRIPSDVAILVLDFNRSLPLRQQFQVHSPHTFVQIDGQMNKVHSWTSCKTLADFTKNLH